MDPDNLGISDNDYTVIIGSFVFVVILMFALYKSRRKIRAHYSSRSKEPNDIIEAEESNS